MESRNDTSPGGSVLSFKKRERVRYAPQARRELASLILPGGCRRIRPTAVQSIEPVRAARSAFQPRGFHVAEKITFRDHQHTLNAFRQRLEIRVCDQYGFHALHKPFCNWTRWLRTYSTLHEVCFMAKANHPPRRAITIALLSAASGSTVSHGLSIVGHFLPTLSGAFHLPNCSS